MAGHRPNELGQLADLLDRLSFTPSRNAKLALMERYFRAAPADEAGYALALMTGELDVPAIKGAALRDLVRTRVGDTLFNLSYAYVGDLGDTVALIWPGADEDDAREVEIGSLAELLARMRSLSPLEVFPFVDRFLSGVGSVERWMFVKLVTGSTLRIGVSARLAKMALGQAFGREVDDIEKVWSAFDPPYEELFAWLRGEVVEPETGSEIFFHPLLLAHPLEGRDLEAEEASDFWAEWKWDGIRVQLASDGEGGRRLFSRTGDDLSKAFPEIIEAASSLRGVVDGELLIRQENLGIVPEGLPAGIFPDIAPFASLQKRLGRKTVSSRLLTELPAILCLYDVLHDDEEDLRDEVLGVRRRRLEGMFEANDLEKAGFRLSPLIEFETWDELASLRSQAREWDVEGFMLKRRDSKYVPGRPKGLWYKWKRDPLLLDAVLLYAERGHGKRSSFFSDYTFGVWSGDEAGEGEIVPVGRAYSGFTDEELTRLDHWVREHTTERFGASVRALEPELVVEVAFDAVQRSTRHRSGVAMRFPRIHRIRWDKPAKEADTMRSVRGFLR